MICGAADEGSAALFVCGGREEWSGSARRADRREVVAWKGRVCWRTGRGAGSARRANRREFVDWCNVWR